MQPTSLFAKLPPHSAALLTILLTSAFAATSAAQSTPGPRRQEPVDHPEVQQRLRDGHAGLRSFQQRAGGAWLARFDEATGAPDFIVGSGLPAGAGPVVSSSDARARAEDVLARFPQLWGCGLSELVFESQVQSGRVHGLTWRQEYDGLAVRGGRVQIQLHDVGRVVAIVAAGVPIPKGFIRTPALTAEQAQAFVKAGKRASSLDVVEAKDLLIYVKGLGGATEPVVAYAVQVDQEDLGIHERVYVDGNTGAILEVEPTRHYFGEVKGQVTGNVNTTKTATGAVTMVPIARCTVTVAGVGSTTTDVNGNYTIQTGLTGPFNVTAALNGAYYNVQNDQGAEISAAATTVNQGPGVDVANLVFNAAPAEFTTSQTNGAFHTALIRDYTKAEIPAFNGYNGQAVNVNLAQTCNAFFDTGSNSINFFASGGGCNNTAFSTIVYHEYGHGVDDYFGGISSGSLSEALGDIFAMYIVADPIVGAGFFTGGGGIRSGENTTTWPASNCGGEVHCVGETYMGFAWQAYKKLKLSLGNGPGAQLAEALFFGTLPFDNTSITTAVTQVFVLDDDNGDLADGTPHYADLASAATLKGFTPPVITDLPIDVAHTRHPDTWNQTQPYGIYATLTPDAPNTITSAFVDYALEGGPILTVPMVATGVPNQYRANIPAQVGPKLISYWVRALDSAANLVKVPVGDDAYRFAVGRKTVLFQDKLDTGAPGWTHVEVQQQDDWNLGKPQTLGTNIYDPVDPYSGSACWGNDLQVSSSQQNGLYQPNIDNYLETPSINASGRTGVRVRYRRWLTVEAGQFDQATMAANGVQIYANPINANLVDTSWTLQDLPATAANGVAAFKVRWRLNSDGGVHLGGWNVDDVEVYALEATPVVTINLAVNTPTPAIGNLLEFQFSGTPGANFELYASAGPGPLSLDGIGVMGLDLATVGFFVGAQLDGTGNFTLPIPIPYFPQLVGLQFYWGAVAATPTSLLQISNTLNTTFTAF
jgi:hypothetical protein